MRRILMSTCELYGHMHWGAYLRPHTEKSLPLYIYGYYYLKMKW